MNRKRGGSLDSSMVFYVVLVVSILNIIAYLSARDITAVFSFVIAAAFMYMLYPDKTISLFVAIIVAAGFRTMYVEGLETEKKEKEEPVEKVPAKEAGEMPDLTQMTETAKLLMKNQKSLFEMADKLEPMMAQSQKLLQNLPEGFLGEALKKLNAEGLKNNKQ
jgi:hypothetical protein